MKIVHEKEIKKLKEQATLVDTYRFFDFDFSVRSDSNIGVKSTLDSW